jgi:hypothetical protein
MRAFWPFSCATAIALLAILPLPAQNDDAGPIGIVSRLKGNWTRVRDQKSLTPGDEIFSNNTVRCDPSTSNAIRIALFDGSVWSKICTAEDPCDGGSYRVPTPPTPERSLLGFLKTYFSARKRIPIIFTASRAVGSRGPREAVLVLRAGTIDLAPALEGIPAGRWQITLSDPSKARETGVTQTLDWPRDTVLRSGNLPNAVYALDVQSESGEALGPPSAALLMSPGSADTAQNQLEDARNVSARWTEVDSATIRAFLVQALYAIQMSTQP